MTPAEKVIDPGPIPYTEIDLYGNRTHAHWMLGTASIRAYDLITDAAADSRS